MTFNLTLNNTWQEYIGLFCMIGLDTSDKVRLLLSQAVDECGHLDLELGSTCRGTTTNCAAGVA